MGCLKLTYREELPTLRVVKSIFFSEEKSSVGVYRYGFNGMEKDNEVKGGGNSYTTEYRQLDVRLGRWLTIDPVFQPYQSPYTSMDNNPVWYNDPLGLYIEYGGEKGSKEYKKNKRKARLGRLFSKSARQQFRIDKAKDTPVYYTHNNNATHIDNGGDRVGEKSDNPVFLDPKTTAEYVNFSIKYKKIIGKTRTTTYTDKDKLIHRGNGSRKGTQYSGIIVLNAGDEVRISAYQNLDHFAIYSEDGNLFYHSGNDKSWDILDNDQIVILESGSYTIRINLSEPTFGIKEKPKSQRDYTTTFTVKAITTSKDIVRKIRLKTRLWHIKGTHKKEHREIKRTDGVIKKDSGWQ